MEIRKITDFLYKVTGITIFLLTTIEAAEAIVVSGNDPNDPYYLVEPGRLDPMSGISLDGVSDLILDQSRRCTGSKIGSRFILTAAHCVTDNFGNLNTSIVQATWTTNQGNITRTSQKINIHPSWNGDLLNGFDIAVIRTAETIPSFIPSYDLYSNTDEVGQIVTIVGYGRSGTGLTGSTLASGTKRQGQNIYDVTGEIFNDVYDGILLADFDSGEEENNIFGGLGLGFYEVGAAPGDSGGPSFINGRIAGVTSFIGTFGSPPDIDDQLNSSFGEFFGSARVSYHINEINELSSVAVPFDVNSSLAFVLFGGLLTSRELYKYYRDH